MASNQAQNLEKIFLKQINDKSLERVKAQPLIDLANPKQFTVTLTRADLRSHQDGGLGLWEWFKNYEKEAQSSTAGIRGLQNIIYPWDTQYPINVIGMLLATTGKALVAQDHFNLSSIRKVAACEVRYNSKLYTELIARVQAAFGITTYVTPDFSTMPIWLVSFLIFMLDLYGGEYVTSSHAISKKNATKDLNHQGSQYIPEESTRFVEKIRNILDQIERNGEYHFTIAPQNAPSINKTLLKTIEIGLPMYVNYLKKGIATPHNLKLINDCPTKIVIDSMGGCMYQILDKMLSSLGILDSFQFLHTHEDPFFHGIGKSIKPNGEITDLGCDTTIMDVNLVTGETKLPVLETMGYRELLKNYPVGTAVLMVDSDGDRLVTAQIETRSATEKLDTLGVVYLELDHERVLSLYIPNQSFLMTLDFQSKALKQVGLWDKYDWFIIKTTASAMTWDEWAHTNHVPVINTPVGFKEIATVMQKVEGLIDSGAEIVVKDVFGDTINLGNNPRMLFAGEESGGEIFGPAELIQSQSGNKAISMREKSGGEAVIITSAMIGYLSSQGKNLSDYLHEIYTQNKIKACFDIRVDHRYYNENEPDINKLLQEKSAGIQLRTYNDQFFLSIAFGLRDHIIHLSQAREILSEAFPQLNFTDLENVHFVGDGTYLKFATKFVEVRPSGTDAINKAYSSSPSRHESVLYAQALTKYSGKRTPKHKALIPDSFYENVKEFGLAFLKQYQREGFVIRPYIPPKSYDYLDAAS